MKCHHAWADSCCAVWRQSKFAGDWLLFNSLSSSSYLGLVEYPTCRCRALVWLVPPYALLERIHRPKLCRTGTQNSLTKRPAHWRPAGVPKSPGSVSPRMHHRAHHGYHLDAFSACIHPPKLTLTSSCLHLTIATRKVGDVLGFSGCAWACYNNNTQKPDKYFWQTFEADLLELRQLEAGERYARSHGPFGCTPRPSSEVSRTSLLGRPLKTGPYRHRDPRYRKSQNLIYNFLERPRGWRAFIYHMLM